MNWKRVGVVGVVLSFAGVAWALDSIPTGAFKVGDKPAIYYSNGKNHYCWYENMESFRRLTNNNPTFSQLPKKLVDYDMTWDGICTGGAELKPAPHPDPTTIAEGNFKFDGRPAIYYTSGNNHYCWYRNMTTFKRIAGKTAGFVTLPSRLSNYGNIYDGECIGKGKTKPAPHPDPNF